MNYSRSISIFPSSKYPLPLSKGTAPHIIMAHGLCLYVNSLVLQTIVISTGVVGHHLHDASNPTRMFISNDAGRNWYSVRLFSFYVTWILFCGDFYSHCLLANTLMQLVTMETYCMLFNALLILHKSGEHLCYLPYTMCYVVSCRVSHDRGKCFQKFPLDTTGHFILRGLVGDFSVGSLVALAFGIPTHANFSSEWIVHAIKFGSALDRPCESSY